MFKIDVLASSSAGNCYVVSKGNFHFLIECGIPFRELNQKLLKLKLNLNDIKFCLISHKHKDHCLCAKELARSGVILIGLAEVVAFAPKKIFAEHKKNIKFEGCTILPFKVNHGVTNNLGYFIKLGQERLMFATDCRLIEMDLRPARVVQMMIECNYVETKINEGTKERRQINTHMGLRSCIEHISKFQTEDLKEIYLMHMSSSYGDEMLSKITVEAQTGVKTYVCGEKGGVK